MKKTITAALLAALLATGTATITAPPADAEYCLSGKGTYKCVPTWE